MCMSIESTRSVPVHVRALLNADERLHLAWEIGREAANFLLTGRPVDLLVETKSTSSDLVSAMDKGAEDIIVTAIRARFPNDGILGEEGTSLESGNGVRWIIDPLDGTVNYLFGIPLWGVSIAVEDNGVVIAGVIVLPTQNEIYVASIDGGAWKVSVGSPTTTDAMSETQIHVRGTQEFSRALLSTGFGYDPERRKAQGELVAKLIPKIADIRRSGCAVVDLCWLASGVTDGYYEYGLNAWDYAAGALLVSEAGGLVAGLEGADFSTFFIGSTPALFEQMRQTLKELEAHSLLNF